MKKLNIISIILLILLSQIIYAPPIVWPSDLEWKPLLQKNGEYFWDKIGDESPRKIDIVGDTSNYPGAYWLYDENGTPSPSDDQLLFRIRLDQEPISSSNYVWSMIIDTNQDGLIEWGLQIDGKKNNDVELVPAVKGGVTIGDIELSKTSTWAGSLHDYSRFAQAPSYFNDNPDGFADFGIQWTTFSSITGFGTVQGISFSPLTATTDQLINKDIPLGLTKDDPVSAILSSPMPVVPEPTTLILFVSVFGISALKRPGRKKLSASA